MRTGALIVISLFLLSSLAGLTAGYAVTSGDEYYLDPVDEIADPANPPDNVHTLAGSLQLTPLLTFEEEATLDEYVRAMAVDEAHHKAYLGTDGGNLYEYDMTTRTLTLSKAGLSSDITAYSGRMTGIFDVSTDGRYIVVVAAHDIYIYDSFDDVPKWEGYNIPELLPDLDDMLGFAHLRTTTTYSANNWYIASVVGLPGSLASMAVAHARGYRMVDTFPDEYDPIPWNDWQMNGVAIRQGTAYITGFDGSLISFDLEAKTGKAVCLVNIAQPVQDEGDSQLTWTPIRYESLSESFVTYDLMDICYFEDYDRLIISGDGFVSVLDGDFFESATSFNGYQFADVGPRRSGAGMYYNLVNTGNGVMLTHLAYSGSEDHDFDATVYQIGDTLVMSEVQTYENIRVTAYDEMASNHYLIFMGDQTYDNHQTVKNIKSFDPDNNTAVYGRYISDFYYYDNNWNIYIATLPSTGDVSIGHFEYLNYEERGTFISAPVECRGEEHNKVIAAVNMSWDIDVPSGTTYDLDITTDGGTTWTNWEAYNGIKHSITDPSLTYDHTFQYRFTFRSPDQLQTPKVESLSYQLFTYVPPNVHIEANGPTFTYAYPDAPLDESEVTFTAHLSGDEDTMFSNLAWYRWDFGDTYASVIPGNPNEINRTYASGEEGQHDLSEIHHYKYPGTYTATLTVMDADGYSTQASTEVTILNRNPVAAWLAADKDSGFSIATGTTVTVDASDSYDLDGAVAVYEIDWGTGDVETFSVPTASHRYVIPGQYNVKLRVKDTNGDWSNNVDTLRVYVSAGDLYPLARFTGPSTIVLGNSATFDGSGSWDDGTIINYTWDLGDGTTAYGPTVTHTYQDGGFYTVSLTVKDNKSVDDPTHVDTYSKELTVQYWPTSGDWIITGHIRPHDVRTSAGGYSGNVIIRDGGWLDMTSVTFLFDCSYDGQYYLLVEDGGRLSTENCTIGTEAKTLNQVEGITRIQHFHFDFRLTGGDAWINNSAIRYVNTDKGANTLGITLSYDSAFNASGSIFELFDETVFSFATPASDPEVNLVSCEAYHNEGTVFYGTADGSFSATDGTYSTNGVFASLSEGSLALSGVEVSYQRSNGIELSGTATADISGCEIKYNGASGIRFGSGTDMDVNGCTIMGSGHGTNAVHASEDATLENCTVGNAAIGIVVVGADVTFLSSEFGSGDDAPTLAFSVSSGHFYFESFLSVIVTNDGLPLAGATVTVLVDGTTSRTLITGSSGRLNWIRVPYYTSTYDPYSGTTMHSAAVSARNDSLGLYDLRIVNMSSDLTVRFDFGTPPTNNTNITPVILIFDTSNIPTWAYVTMGIAWALFAASAYYYYFVSPQRTRAKRDILVSAAAAAIVSTTLFVGYYATSGWLSWVLYGAAIVCIGWAAGELGYVDWRRVWGRIRTTVRGWFSG